MVFLAPPNTESVDESQLRSYLQATLDYCRQGTLTLVKGISSTVLTQQAHPDFSPVGWHLGHVAFTESLWILEHLAHQPCPFPAYRTLFAADGLPKTQRQRLPSLDDLLAFLSEIRKQTLAYLSTASLTDDQRLWHWLIQHECQHSETISLVMALHQNHGQSTPLGTPTSHTQCNIPIGMVSIPGGKVCLGLEAKYGLSDEIAIDNEQPAYSVDVAPYQIDRTPVTCGQYRQFMAAGGYQDRQWWCDAGWRWLQTANVNQPLYWPEQRMFAAFRHHPVCGVNWYEASAYARFVDKRLPTEAEWALAAKGLSAKLSVLLKTEQINCDHRLGQTTTVGSSGHAVSDYGCYDLLGNVWEWTSSWFRPYPGFDAYPYKGYSAVYFDDCHRVLRGGSWATRPWVLRPSFRNWYEPHVRELFTGFRCVQ